MKHPFLLKANNLNKSFSSKSSSKTTVLENLNVSFIKNEFTSIMGPSGIGKSTLLYLLGTLDKPDSGEILYFDGKNEVNLSSLNDKDISIFRNKNIGFVFQFHHLLPEFTAIENVIIPALIQKRTVKEATSDAERLLEIVGVQHRKKNKPSELSGGEQQRIAIARALINNPSLLIADEPTGNLDASNTKSVLNLISDLRTKIDITIIVATHSADVAQISDRVLIMGEGIIKEEKI